MTSLAGVLPPVAIGARVLRSFGAIVVAAVALRLCVYAWMALPYGGLVQAMCNFDCGWYERIALSGYDADANWANLGSYPHWAFFPLYPLGVAVLHQALEISARASGMLLSSLCLCGLAVLGARHLQSTRRYAHAVLWLIVLLLFPYSFLFSAVYTEALFAVLSAASLLALARRQVLLAAALAAFVSATRPTGVVLTVIIAVDRLCALWRGRHRRDRVALLAQAALPFAVAPLGLFMYMLEQYIRIGDALAFSHVQMLWNRRWGDPFARIGSAMTTLDFGGLLMLPSHAYEASFAAVGLLGAAWLAYRRRGAEAAFLAGCILLPAATGVDSLPRFVSTNPVFLYLVYDLAAAALLPVARPMLLGGFAAVLAGLQALLLIGWYTGAGGVF